MMESPLNRKRYSVTKGIVLPANLRRLWAGHTPLIELMAEVYAWIGDMITGGWLDAERGCLLPRVR